MKIVCQQADLYQALSTVTHALSPKSPIPALDYILIKSEKGDVTLTCSDLHMTIVSRLPGFADSDGQVLLPGRLLTEIVRKLPDSEVTMEISANFGVTIRALQTRTTLQGLSADNFPELPRTPDAAVSATLSQLTFRDMIRQTAFAVATDDLRPILTGCLIQCEGDVLTMVSLDSFRMALRKAQVMSTDGDFSFVAPGKYLLELSKILGDIEDMVTLRFGGNHLLVNLGLTDIKIRLLEGEYIKYKQIIPAESSTRIVVSRKDFNDCVERAALIARDGKTNLIKMNITGDMLVITSNNDLGDIYEEINCSKFGNDITIAFNVRYISDVLKNVDDDNVMILLNSPVSPGTIVPEEGDSYLYLVLPVRTH